MIRPIDIRLNAAHPELPLAEAVTFTGSPSTVLVRGVPPNCGRWAITAVFVAATYPDGSTTTRAAVQSANGVWVATLPATARSGRTENGLRVMADGIDENGAAVTGYILGVADFAVASLGVTPAPEPGETSWQMLYFDAVPGTLRKGDVAKVDGVLKLYNGTAWEAFAGDIPAPSTATPAMDGTGAAGTSAAFARGDHVHPTDTSRVPTSRTVNGQPLSADVTLTGADIAVSGSDATKIDTALAGKASIADLDPLLFAQYYPDGSVKSAAEFTPGIKYDAPDTVNRTITVKPFCNTGDSDNDNSPLSGRVVIPPFVDAQGNPYISDDVTRFKVVGVSGFNGRIFANTNPTAVLAPNTVTTISGSALAYCTALSSVALPAAAAIGDFVFASSAALASVDFGDTPRPDVPTLGNSVFAGVPSSCKIIVPYTQYDAWIAADSWRDLQQEFVRHSEKADKPATFTEGNLAALDASGNPTDSGIKPSDKLDSTSAAPAFSTDSSVSYPVGSHVTYNGKLYVCTTATTGGTWVAASWTADTMTDPDAVLDITAQNQLRVVAKDGTLLWAQGYDLASTSSATLACDACNNFTFVDGATTQAFALPTAPSGKVGDFGLDIDNSANTGAATMTLTGLDTAFSVVVPEGESLNDMLAIAAGELARFYITLTTFRVNNLPTWHIMKQIVENGGATV